MRSVDKNIIYQVAIRGFISKPVIKTLYHNHRVTLKNYFMNTNCKCKLHSTTARQRFNLDN